MPTISEAEELRASRARRIRLLMARKEEMAVERLKILNERVTVLEPLWKQFLALYATHIKPLEPSVREYFDSLNEIKRHEHFLQGQDAFRAKEKMELVRPTVGEPYLQFNGEVQRLPYADKNQVGRKPKKEPALDDAAAKSFMEQLKKMDPKLLAALLKDVGGK